MVSDGCLSLVYPEETKNKRETMCGVISEFGVEDGMETRGGRNEILVVFLLGGLHLLLRLLPSSSSSLFRVLHRCQRRPTAPGRPEIYFFINLDSLD